MTARTVLAVPRLNYEIPDDLHRRVRVAAAEQGVTIKAFLLAALESALRGSPDPQRGRRRQTG